MCGLVKKKKISSPFDSPKTKKLKPILLKPKGPRVANKLRSWSLSPATKLEKVVCPFQNHQMYNFFKKTKKIADSHSKSS